MALEILKKISTPLGWLAASALGLFALLQINLALTPSIVLAVICSMVTVLLVTRNSADEPSPLIPIAGAGLFSCFAWIAVLLVPGSAVATGIAGETAFMARMLVVLISLVVMMPLLVFGEMIVSIVMVQAISRLRGASVLGGELRVVALVDRKFSGLFGSKNR